MEEMSIHNKHHVIQRAGGYKRVALVKGPECLVWSGMRMLEGGR